MVSDNPDCRTPQLCAVVFDVDGTLSDTERDAHRPAFNAAFAAHGLDIIWDVEQYGQLLAVTGGARRIAADLRARGFGDDADELAVKVHRTKTDLFRALVVSGEVLPRPGLLSLVRSLVEEGIRIAVATTGRRAWVDPLLGQIFGDGIVEVVVTGDDVDRLKPDPEVYLRVLDGLGVSPENAVAVEDSAIGLRAAVAANLATIVVTTGYTAGQDFTGAAMVRGSFEGVDALTAASCVRAHRQWSSAGHTDR